MRFLHCAVGAFVLSFVSIGCASKNGEPATALNPDAATADAGSVGSPCSSDTDCAGNTYCGFDITGGCAAPGSCQARGGDGVCAPSDFVTLCSCTGWTAQYCREPAPMYTGIRVAHLGACEDGGKDAATD